MPALFWLSLACLCTVMCHSTVGPIWLYMLESALLWAPSRFVLFHSSCLSFLWLGVYHLFIKNFVENVGYVCESSGNCQEAMFFWK